MIYDAFLVLVPLQEAEKLPHTPKSALEQSDVKYE